MNLGYKLPHNKSIQKRLLYPCHEKIGPPVIYRFNKGSLCSVSASFILNLRRDPNK